MICPFCEHPTDSDDHVFNVNCALSNAENDQMEAEVNEISVWQNPDMALGLIREKHAYVMGLIDDATEVLLDKQALAKINREQTPPYTNDWPPAL